MARKDISNKLIFGSDRKDDVILLFGGKRSCLKYTLNDCKLDREENIFDFYVEPTASKIKILVNITNKFCHENKVVYNKE